MEIESIGIKYSNLRYFNNLNANVFQQGVSRIFMRRCQQIRLSDGLSCEEESRDCMWRFVYILIRARVFD